VRSGEGYPTKANWKKGKETGEEGGVNGGRMRRKELLTGFQQSKDKSIVFINLIEKEKNRRRGKPY